MTEDRAPESHHSAQQVREDDGRWRSTPGYAHADHARPVPVAKLGGEQVEIVALAIDYGAQPGFTVPAQVDNRLLQAQAVDEIARMFALPAELIRSR